MCGGRQPEVTYEFIERADVEERLRHVYEILVNANLKCLTTRTVVPSDEIGETNFPANTDTQENTPTPTADPSRRRV